MRYLGGLWEQCHNGTIPKGEWDYERRLTIDGVAYLDDNIIKVEQEKSLTGDTISLGNAVASKLSATVLPHTDHIVRKNSEIKLELRVVTLNNGSSDWYEFGYYYIDSAKREADKWSITAYDKLYSLETPFPALEGQSFTATQAIYIIVDYMGISVDSRSLPFVSQDNLSGLEDYSMREVLGYLGSLNYGNWHITEENKLHLIRFGVGVSEYNVGKSNSKKLIDSTPMSFDKVIVKYGQNPSEKYEAGSGDSELEIFNPWATPVLADNILDAIQNITFYPGEIRSAEIDPALELGDTITVEGNNINMWQVDYSTRMYADIQTPEDTEEFSQYQFKGSSGGQDYSQDINNINDRLGILEDLFGISECVIISDRNGNVEYVGYFKYTGNDKCVIIPREVLQGGGDVFNTNKMFEDSYVNKVILNHNAVQGSMAYMFQNLKSTSLDLSTFNTSEVRDMSSIFENSNVIYLDLTGFDTSNVTDMSRMFRDSQAEDLLISSFDTSNVTDMSSMFAGTKAKDLLISSFNTSNVTDMNGMFARSQAEDLLISSFDTSNVTDMSSMFSGSSSTTLNLYNFDTSNVTDMSGMFSGSQVTTLDLSSFDTSNVTDMSSMLQSIQVTTLDLSLFDTSKVTSMNSMFSGSQVTELDLSSFDTSNVTRMDSMFSGSQATELELSSFDTSNVTYMSSMFSHSEAESLDVSNFDTSNVTEMEAMFSGCYNLEHLDLSNFDTSNVEEMGGMFVNCDNLVTLDLSGNFRINQANSRQIFPYKVIWDGYEVPTHLTVYCNVDNYSELLNQYEEDYNPFGENDSNISFIIK